MHVEVSDVQFRVTAARVRMDKVDDLACALVPTAGVIYIEDFQRCRPETEYSYGHDVWVYGYGHVRRNFELRLVSSDVCHDSGPRVPPGDLWGWRDRCERIMSGCYPTVFFSIDSGFLDQQDVHL